MQDVKYQESHSNYGVCSWALRKEIKVKKGGHKYGPNPKPRLYVSGIVLMWGTHAYLGGRKMVSQVFLHLTLF